MTRILVTGATGFIGRHLVPQLRIAGHEVTEANSQSGDIGEESTWSKFQKAELIVHLAGKTFVPDSWADPAGFIKCNLQGTVAALNYCKTNDARLVFLSSYLYGNPLTLPIPETAPLIANNPYALSKKLAEEACEFYAENFDLTVTILRPFNVYGQGQPEHFLIPSIIRQVNAGKTIHVKDLEPKRDYVYVGDLIDAIVKAIALRRGLNIFNIGTGLSYSVAELIALIQQVKGTHLDVQASGEVRVGEVMDTRADVEKAKAALNWRPTVSLLEGLSKIG